jgi:asparagine synthase (glutamine-hydrolysing)
MSAIFGLVAVRGDGLPGHALEAMRSALADHGGDGGDTWALGGASLGQQLKLTTPEDLFERQPLVSRDGLRVLVSDGRIDNRPELSGELGLPRSARTVPDSAFILAAYERWGTDCLQHLIGSFCFAVWDAGPKRLLLARAPFSARPVFFHQATDFVAFATMPRALFALPGVPRRLCLESVADNLILVPAEPGASLFHDIRSLEPGHALTVEPRGCHVRAFWKPELRRELRLRRDEEYVEAFTERFDRVVADHLRSLGPVGVLMSGGLDSTSVAATAAPLLARRGERLAAFTAAPRDGFLEVDAPHWLVDEAPLASTVAARYENIDLSVIRTEGRFFLDELDRYFDAAEMPYEATASRVWHEGIMAEAQRRGVRVLLTGKCGNWTVSWNGSGLMRSLIGTGRWAAAWREAGALASADRARPTARALVSGGFIPQLPWKVQLAIARRRGADDPLLAPGAWWAPISPIHPEFARAQSVAARSRARGCDHWFRRRIDTPERRCARLMHVQRLAGMNGAFQALYGTDIRDPTADVRIAEFCLSLPEEQYRRGDVSRWLIRRAMADRLPAEILASPRRGIDTADWFERLCGAQARVFETLHLLEQSETASTVLDLPRMRRLADQIDQPARDPVRKMTDYRHVLERGLMVGRFLRWFEGSRDS